MSCHSEMSRLRTVFKLKIMWITIIYLVYIYSLLSMYKIRERTYNVEEFIFYIMFNWLQSMKKPRNVTIKSAVENHIKRSTFEFCSKNMHFFHYTRQWHFVKPKRVHVLQKYRKKTKKIPFLFFNFEVSSAYV